MVWFFLAGFVSGAVGMVMFAHWYMERHIVEVRYEKSEDDNADSGHSGNDDQRDDSDGRGGNG